MKNRTYVNINLKKKIKQEWIKRPYTTNHSHIFPDSKLWDFNSILKYRDLKRWTTTSFPGRTYIVLLTQEHVYPALCSLTLFQQRGLETREEETRERCWYSNHWGAFEERISIAITNKINLPFLLSPSPPFWGLWVPWCWVPGEGRNRQTV